MTVNFCEYPLVKIMVVHVTRGRFKLSIFTDIKSWRCRNLHDPSQPFKTITQHSSPSHINKSLKRNLFLNSQLEMKMSSVLTKVLKSITRYRSRLNVERKCLICPSWRAANSSCWGETMSSRKLAHLWNSKHSFRVYKLLAFLFSCFISKQPNGSRVGVLLCLWKNPKHKKAKAIRLWLR